MIRKVFGCVAGMALALAITSQANAAPISGQIDIAGLVITGSSDFQPGGSVDFGDQNPGVIGDQGTVQLATGDFAGVTLFLPVVDLFDIDFNVLSAIWSIGGFTFTPTSYGTFDNVGPTLGFVAQGIISAAGFDNTKGVLTFSTQGDQGVVSFSSTTVVPLPPALALFATGLAGIGFLGRRRRKQTLAA